MSLSSHRFAFYSSFFLQSLLPPTVYNLVIYHHHSPPPTFVYIAEVSSRPFTCDLHISNYTSRRLRSLIYLFGCACLFVCLIVKVCTYVCFDEKDDPDHVHD